MTVRSRPNQKWFNDNLRSLKRTKRSIERSWKKHKTSYWENKLKAVKQEYKDAIFHARTNFYSVIYDNNKSDLKKVYKTTKYLIGDQASTILPTTSNKFDLANEMAAFYKNKVVEIRKEIVLSKASETIDHVLNAVDIPLISPEISMSNFKMFFSNY